MTLPVAPVFAWFHIAQDEQLFVQTSTTQVRPPVLCVRGDCVQYGPNKTPRGAAFALADVFSLE